MQLKKTYSFLEQLRKNNSKEWFDLNRKNYYEAKEEFLNYISKILEKLKKFAKEIPALKPNDFMFRINRDTRFSKDKSPYKTFFAAFFSFEGRKSPFAGYYLHIEPQNTFLGGGVYCVDKKFLNAIRQKIYNETQRFLKIINDDYFRKQFNGIYGKKLKKIPKGFDKNFPYSDLLKFKQYALYAKIEDSPEIETVINIFKKMQPFNDFLNEAIFMAKNKDIFI